MKMVFVSGGNGKEDAQSQGGCGGNGKTPTIIYYDATYKTNADRFRAKTDEELAELFTHLCCPYSLGGGGKLECNIENKGCKACWLDWLKQEAAE